MGFDEYAKTWDTDKRIERAKIISNKIVELVNIKEEWCAMEFGCGTGLISFNIYDKFKSIDLIDSSQGMIDIVKSKIKEYGVVNMTPYMIDIFSEDMKGKRFDIIYSSMVLHHIEDTKAIIKRFYELLNEGGYLCIVDLDKEDGSFHKNYPDFNGHNGFDQENLKEILSNMGFKDIVSNTFFIDDKIIQEEKISYSLFLMKARKN